MSRIQPRGNILALEHVNLAVPDPQLAHLFYVTGLGLTRDPYMDFGLHNFWVNAGSEQIHLPTGEPQVLPGITGLALPDVEALEARLLRLRKNVAALQNTKFGWSRQGQGLLITCPWGNRYAVSAAAAQRPGIPWVQLQVPSSACPGLADFYAQVFAARVSLDADMAVVHIGRNQQLRFAGQPQNARLPEYDGHHIAIYLEDFAGPYQKLQDLGLVTRETGGHEYRFDTLVHMQTGAVLARLEHEVRSRRHPLYGRELVNRNAAQNIRSYQPGEDAAPGFHYAGRG